MTFRISSRVTAVGLASLLCLRAGAAFAQTPSLVELAQKEQERRKALKGATGGKVYSDKDLPKPATPAIASSLPPATPTPVPDEKPPEAKPPDQKEETVWRTRMAQAREAQRRAEMFAEALQSRINALTTDFSARSDPAQRAVIGTDRQKALAELDRVKKEIETQTKEIADIQEEARKANVPPGWLR